MLTARVKAAGVKAVTPRRAASMVKVMVTVNNLNCIVKERERLDAIDGAEPRFLQLRACVRASRGTFFKIAGGQNL